MCIALYAIVFSYLIVIHRWQQEDLDLVLFLGDELNKSFNTQQYLSTTDLRTNILVCNTQVQASHFHNNYGMLLNNKDLRNYLTHCLSSHSRESTRSILFITGLCIAVIPRGRETVFIFDSHGRNWEGRPDLNGYSVLIKFSNLVAVANYVISCYCQGTVVQFEAQNVAVYLEQFSTSTCLRPVRNCKNRIQNLNFGLVYGIDQIENAKPTKIRKTHLNFNYEKVIMLVTTIVQINFSRWFKRDCFIFVVLVIDVFTVK